MTTMEAVTALVTKMDALIGCLGCGEPVPVDSLSDLFCAKLISPVNCGWDDCDRHDPVLETCQETALNRMAHDPDAIYDIHPSDEDVCNYVPARWYPGIEDGTPAPVLPVEIWREADEW